jgi:hypothetical protein
MTRTQTAATSLVAAIPAGILVALLVMTLLNHFGNLALMGQLLVIGTLVVTAVVALVPFGVLIFSGKKPAAAKKGAKASGEEDATIATSDEIVSRDDEGFADSAEETETIAFAPSDEGDTDDLGDLDEFSTDDLDDFEEDEPPKKKGKKK